MAKWIGAARAAEAAEHDSDSDTDGDNVPAPTARIHATPSRSVPLSVLFGGTVKRSQRVSQLDEELMQALAEQLEDDRLDDGAIEDDGDAYGA